MTSPRPGPDALLVVPDAPGPLVPLRRPSRQPDEVDEALDELLGADDDRGPGAFDLALLGGGSALGVAGALARNGLAEGAGVVAVAIGLVLPLRWLWRTIGQDRTRRAAEGAQAAGRLLRVDAPATAALADLHARLLEAPATDPDRLAAGHLAVREVASLLEGRAPDGAAELEYVERRRAALARLVAAPPATTSGAIDPDHERRQALAEARAELDAATGTSSLDQIAALLDPD